MTGWSWMCLRGAGGSAVAVADAGERVPLSIGLLIKSSAHLPDLTRQIYKQRCLWDSALTASHSDRG